MKRIIITSITILLLSCVIILSIPKTSKNTEKANKVIPKNDESSFVLKLYDDELVLYENENIIKRYDVTISVLPSEDIFLLSNGIKVKDVAEADAVAENFDG